MEAAETFFGMAAVLTVGTIWLAAFLFGVYRLGRFAGRVWHPRPSWSIYALPAAAFVLLASLVWLLPTDRFTRLIFSAIAWVSMAYPYGVGVWIQRAIDRRRREEELWRRTREWLAEWEESNQP
ncbi:MAG: hypothetical protein N2109_11655 [Fimbriimonadales bacterium]|nr:hypothetical protein [Fimbriimonadales bacterium]